MEEKIDLSETALTYVTELIGSEFDVVEIDFNRDCIHNPYGPPVMIGGTMTIRFIGPQPRFGFVKKPWEDDSCEIPLATTSSQASGSPTPSSALQPCGGCSKETK